MTFQGAESPQLTEGSLRSLFWGNPNKSVGKEEKGTFIVLTK